MPFSMCTDVFPSSILLQPNTWCIRQPFFFFPALLSETIAYAGPFPCSVLFPGAYLRFETHLAYPPKTAPKPQLRPATNKKSLPSCARQVPSPKSQVSNPKVHATLSDDTDIHPPLHPTSSSLRPHFAYPTKPPVTLIVHQTGTAPVSPEAKSCQSIHPRYSDYNSIRSYL
ncbi:hypothetical protein BR93DRAFT_525477 [Coniochaeta sp. PMI_546]|nr:hypothetical protein BR93DRAFT_525477 [Coniochaeta sp. PMI_546]